MSARTSVARMLAGPEEWNRRRLQVLLGVAVLVVIAVVAYMMLVAKENAKLTDHTNEPIYPCTPVCAPVTPEMERAFGKSDEEIVRDAIEYERELKR